MARRKFFVPGAVIAMGLLACWMVSTPAQGGTVLAQQAGSSASGSDEYPPSSFGEPPANGFSEGFAARQAIDMDTSPDGSGQQVERPAGISRGLASVGDSPISMTQSAPTQAAPAGGNADSQDIPDSVVSRRGVQEVSVIASDLGYFPKTIFVSRSVPVRLYVTSASKNTLCIMMDSFQVRKQVKAGKIEEITFVPNVPGQYRFYCPVNGMEGSMVVKEFSSPFQSAEQFEPVQNRGYSRGLAGGEQPMGQAAAPIVRRQSEREVPSVQAQWGSGGFDSAPAIDPNEGPGMGSMSVGQ